jgi:hypothetical protein
MNYPIEPSLGTSFGKSEEWGKKIPVCVFPYCTVPVCEVTPNIAVGNTAHYVPSKLGGYDNISLHIW